MSEPVFSLARIIAPRAKDPNGPEALGEKLAGLLGRAQTYLEDHIIPNPPETYTQPWTQLCFIHVRKLRRHIRRQANGRMHQSQCQEQVSFCRLGIRGILENCIDVIRRSLQ